MELKIIGEDKRCGLTLAEVRSFVSQTEDWPGETWMDGYVPHENPAKPPVVAALMGLYAGENTACPRCSAPLRGEPVMHPISRVDNVSRICNNCGNLEAVHNHFWPDKDLPPINERIVPSEAGPRAAARPPIRGLGRRR